MPDFGHFISLDRMNSVSSFNKYEIYLSHFWLLASVRKIYPSIPKNKGFVRLRGGCSPSPVARTSTERIVLYVLTRSSAIAVIADRTACNILTLFIVIATSRPLNKKSVCGCNNYCGSASANPQSAHLCSAPAVGSRHRPRSAVAPNGTVQLLTTSRLSLSPIYTVMAFLARF